MHHVRIAAVGDIHCARHSEESLRPFFAEMAEAAEVLLLCGDLTDYGLPREAHHLVEELADCQHLPVIAVFGNHDFESGKQEELRDILGQGGVTVLDGESSEVHGIGFAGVKGFGGGFGDRMLEPWGEEAVKSFVREGMHESLKLEAALARLRPGPRIVLLHYSPIEATVESEARELFPFLGCRRLEEPINRYEVTAAFHGHAHNGCPEGSTATGIPVFNVARPLLQKVQPDRPPYRLLDVEVSAPAPV
jgi:Icc-related predicted phosphoesterase